MLFAIQEAKKFPENSNLRKIHNQFGQGNGAIAACWQAKAGVEPPFAGR